MPLSINPNCGRDRQGEYDLWSVHWESVPNEKHDINKSPTPLIYGVVSKNAKKKIQSGEVIEEFNREYPHPCHVRTPLKSWDDYYALSDEDRAVLFASEKEVLVAELSEGLRKGLWYGRTLHG